MGTLNKHSDHKIKCPACGEVYDLRYLDQVAKHLHTGIVIDETIKGTKVNKTELPERVISKLGLTSSGITIGESFVNNCRVFEIPELAEVYVMECDSNGKPKTDNTVSVFFRRQGAKNRGIVSISIEYLDEITRADFINSINIEVKRNEF